MGGVFVATAWPSMRAVSHLYVPAACSTPRDRTTGVSVYQIYSVDTTGNESAAATAQLLVRTTHTDTNLQD